MAFGSNVSQWDFNKDYVDTNAIFDIGSELRKRNYQGKVADAMKGVTGKFANLSNEQLKERLEELRAERGQILAQGGASVDPATGYELQDSPKVEGEFDTYKDPNATGFGDVMGTIGKGVGMGLAAPFYGAYKGIEYLANKIKNGTATPEEIKEYQKAKEEESGVPVFGGAPMNPMRGATGGYRGTVQTSPRITNEPIDAPLFGGRADMFNPQPTPAYMRRTGMM